MFHRLSHHAACGLAAVGSSLAIAQPFQHAVGTQFQDTAYEVRTEAAGAGNLGGSILVGEAAPSLTGGLRDIIVSRHLANGTQIWNGRYGLTTTDEVGYSIQPVSDGYVVGFEHSLNPNLGVGIMRLDQVGNIVWVRIYPGLAFAEYPAGVCVRVMSNKDLVLVGRARNPQNQRLDGLVLRTDSNGNPLFIRRFTAGNVNLPDVSLTGVVELPDNTLAISGTISAQPAVGGPRVSDLLYLRLTPVGIPLVFRRFGGQQTNETGDGIDFSTASGFAGLVISGRQQTLGSPLAFDSTNLLVVTPAGAPVTLRNYSNILGGYQAVRFAAPAGVPGIVVAGAVVTQTAGGSADAALLGVDAAGNPVIKMRYGGPLSFETAHGVESARFASNRLVLAGATDLPVVAPRDMYFLMTDSLGRTGCLENNLPIEVRTLNPQFSDPSPQWSDGDLGTFTQYPRFEDVRDKFICPTCSPCAGDLNNDGFVDDADFVLFTACYDAFIVVPGCECSDLNGDGFVDDADFVIFAAAYDQFVCP